LFQQYRLQIAPPQTTRGRFAIAPAIRRYSAHNLLEFAHNIPKIAHNILEFAQEKYCSLTSTKLQNCSGVNYKLVFLALKFEQFLQ
jgi:hypothetical protein